jgi:hypothetical protein
MLLRLLNAVTATDSAPSAATDGHSLRHNQPGLARKFNWRGLDHGAIKVKGAGTGALTFQGIVYVYDPESATWSQLGMSPTIADRGKLNDGTTITGTTTLNHTQPIQGLSAYTRIALQVSTLTGTSMTVSAWLISRGTGRV